MTTLATPANINTSKLAPLDLDQFWADQEVAIRAPFGHNIPQLPLGIMMSYECVFAELGVEEDWHRLVHDEAYRVSLCKAYNDISEEVVGRRLLNEKISDPTRQYPEIKKLYDIFEGENIWHNDSYWLKEAAHNEKELASLLERVERRLENLRDFVLPANWEEEKQRLSSLGIKSPVYRAQRGPVTFATSIFGVENLIYLIEDEPELAERYRDLILKSILELARIQDQEAGYTEESAPRGFYFLDDNCCMLNYDMYEFFGYPILKGVFERFSPDENDMRGQHSDSNMEHLLPLFGKLGMTSVNFGPTLSVRSIREHCPKAVIHGQLAPFTFSRDQEDNMVEELMGDFEQAKEHRGLVFATAGSINNGSRLGGMRLIMSTIQRRGRF